MAPGGDTKPLNHVRVYAQVLLFRFADKRRAVSRNINYAHQDSTEDIVSYQQYQAVIDS